MDFIFDPSLVLYLPLYELDGASFKSRDAYGHLCTLTGAVWRPNGHYFDGTDDYINCGHPPAFDITQAITLEAWIRFTTAKHAGIIAKFLTPTAKAKYCFTFNEIDDGTVGMYISENGTGTDGVASAVTVNDGHWHHCVGIFDGDYLRVFVDGELSNSKDTTLAAIFDKPDMEVWIGNYDEGNDTRWFNGDIGEVRIYNRALTPQEIQRNYLATKWRYC